MNTHEALSDADIEKIVEWAKRHRVIERIYLFGSRARGDYKADSDIDLAIEMDFDAWFDWYSKYKRDPDLHLSHRVQLEWYKPNAGLGRVGTGVQRDGLLIYEREGI